MPRHENSRANKKQNVMKKVLLSLVLCGFVGAGFAQMNFGVTAGLNVSNVFKSGGGKQSDWKPGFQAGAFMDLAITPQLSLIPELLFTQRGFKDDSGGGGIYSSTINCLSLPVNVAYNLDLATAGKLFPFAGLYVGYALSGSWNDTSTGGGSGDLKFGSNPSEINPLDFGLNIGAGYQFMSYIVKLQYNLGLANLSNSSSNTAKNANVAFTVGYQF